MCGVAAVLVGAGAMRKDIVRFLPLFLSCVRGTKSGCGCGYRWTRCVWELPDKEGSCTMFGLANVRWKTLVWSFLFLISVSEMNGDCVG
jgi:hypothetical protein